MHMQISELGVVTFYHKFTIVDRITMGNFQEHADSVLDSTLRFTGRCCAARRLSAFRSRIVT